MRNLSHDFIFTTNILIILKYCQFNTDPFKFILISNKLFDLYTKLFSQKNDLQEKNERNFLRKEYNTRKLIFL